MRPLLLLTTLLLSPLSWGQDADPRADQLSEAAVAALAAQSPEAAERFAAADAARDAGNPALAGAAYADVLALVPDFVPALRRHCLVLQESGLRDEALPRCRRALELDDAPENRVALAYVLLDRPEGIAAGPAERTEARRLLAEAWARDPDDVANARLRCQLAVDEDDLQLLAACTADLDRLAPDHVLTAWHVWLLAQREGRVDDALAALERAQDAGMPAEDVAVFRELTRSSAPRWTGPPRLLLGLVFASMIAWGFYRLARAGK